MTRFHPHKGRKLKQCPRRARDWTTQSVARLAPLLGRLDLRREHEFVAATFAPDTVALLPRRCRPLDPRRVACSAVDTSGSRGISTGPGLSDNGTAITHPLG